MQLSEKPPLIRLAFGSLYFRTWYGTLAHWSCFFRVALGWIRFRFYRDGRQVR